MPWYTLHKIDAGLGDAALLRLADFGVAACRPLSDAAFEAMPEAEHGGMNEAYADLSATYRDVASPDSRGRSPWPGCRTKFVAVPSAGSLHRAWQETARLP